MLWVGWFGFNAGSGLAANGDAAQTLFVTHISAATATISGRIEALPASISRGTVTARHGPFHVVARLSPESSVIVCARFPFQSVYLGT
jgi:ammonia channel protein AmtB